MPVEKRYRVYECIDPNKWGLAPDNGDDEDDDTMAYVDIEPADFDKTVDEKRNIAIEKFIKLFPDLERVI